MLIISPKTLMGFVALLEKRTVPSLQHGSYKQKAAVLSGLLKQALPCRPIFEMPLDHEYLDIIGT